MTVHSAGGPAARAFATDIAGWERHDDEQLEILLFSVGAFIEKAGTEGVEVIMWLAMRGALSDQVRCLHKHYHTPISNTGAGVLLLENT